MNAFLLYAAVAFALGVLTSISPCPLATNIAAVSYVGRKVGTPRAVLGAGLLYTLGRCLLYLALAWLFAVTALKLRDVSVFLQTQAPLVLAPVFLLMGMFLAGLITSNLGGASMSESMQKRIDGMGAWGALLLGVLFAVSFCPTSAMWFFGLLAVMMGSEAGQITSLLARWGIELGQLPTGGTLLLPVIYGIGTAIPVLILTFLLAFSAGTIGKAFGAMTRLEWWARNITGWLFILLGCYFALVVFELV